MEGTPFGRYRLLTLLGRGGMGEVWRAHDTETDRIVALKVLPAHLTDDDVFQQRFRREARAAAGLYEPHVVPIHHYGEIDGRLYVDMRLIVGTDLDTLLDAGPLDPARAVKIVEQVASALHAAHQIGLAHRDVKPSNVLVAENDFAYLDFGIAGMAGEAGATGTGSSIGTWAYLAPERFGAGEPDARSDIYALACVLHQCLTGRRPFPGDRIEQQVAGHMSIPPPLPSAVNYLLPTSFDDVVARGMAKDPDDRYHTTVALAAAAGAAQEAAPVRTIDESSDRPRCAAPTQAPGPALSGQLNRVVEPDERQPPVHRVPLSNNVFAEEDPVVEDAPAPPPPPPAKPSPPSDWRASPPIEGLRSAKPGRGRFRVSPAIVSFVAIVVVGVAIAIVATVDDSRRPNDSSPVANAESSAREMITDSSAPFIRQTVAGGCISKVQESTNPDGGRTVAVTRATCGTPEATDRVTMRTNDPAYCSQEWVESPTPAPPVVLCLDPE